MSRIAALTLVVGYIGAGALGTASGQLGTAEKWDALSWKTDAFYGDPLTGFCAP